MARKTLRGNVTLIYFSSDPSDASAITQAEITAGTDITGVTGEEAAESLNGFEEQASIIQTPDLLSLQTANIPGEITTSAADIRYYTDDATNAVWTALPRGTVGGLGIFPFDTAATSEYQYWPFSVINRTRMNISGNEAEKHSISMALGIPVDGVAAA